MKFVLRLPLIFIVCLCKSISGQPEVTSYQIIENRELSDIESKISRDLFFRGEVADWIIENGLISKITSKTFSSYSQAREFLIFWIAANPKAASEFYAMAKARNPLILNGEISYTITSARLTDRFNRLVETLKQAADDNNLSQEEKRLAAARLFEGFVDYGDGYVDTYSGNKSVNQFREEDYANISAFKLNQSALFESERKIRELLPIFSKLVSVSEDKKTKEAFLFFKSNLETLSVEAAALAGSSNLTSWQAEKIKKILFLARRSSFSFLSLYKAENLVKIAGLLPDSPLKEKLLFWAKRLEINSSIFQSPSLTDTQAKELFEFLKLQAELSQKQAEAYMLCHSIEQRIKKLVFSGYYDAIFYKLMSLFYPDNEYRKIVSKIKENSIKLALFKDKNLYLRLEEKDLEMDFLKNLNEMINKKEKISAISLKMQFLLFEFFLPFDLRLEPGKIYIRLNSDKILA